MVTLITRRWRALGTALLLLLATAAQAHLMVAQRGTVQVVGDGAFVVVSLPVSAFTGIGADGDGRLTLPALRTHWGRVEAEVRQRLQLSDGHGPRPLEGLILSLAPAQHSEAPSTAAGVNIGATQIVVMGRFALASPAAGALRLSTDLYGRAPAEQVLNISASRSSGSGSGGVDDSDSGLLVLSPARPSQPLFPARWAVFSDYLALGAGHILGGYDHLLFLLVVLAAGWRWRQALLAVSTFTLGHALTLGFAVWGGWQAPAALVEPLIAATIVGMAAFDWRQRRLRGTADADANAPAIRVRLALVFACALIHGLGLAQALAELGLDSTHRLLSLAGFNLGIEIGQLAVAGAAAGVMAAIRRLRGAEALDSALRAASLAAMALGGAWFVQRLVT
jgi:hypothetical protein